jgi:alpha-amylase
MGCTAVGVPPYWAVRRQARHGVAITATLKELREPVLRKENGAREHSPFKNRRLQQEGSAIDARYPTMAPLGRLLKRWLSLAQAAGRRSPQAWGIWEIFCPARSLPAPAAALLLVTLAAGSGSAGAAEQPTAILHAHDEPYQAVAQYVCTLPDQGYSHIQIAPAQKSHPGPIAAPMGWSVRYQPIDYRLIEGRGSQAELRSLIARAHGCGIKVIADVVFNHMANMAEYKDLVFPTFGPGNFHPRCPIAYDNNRVDDERDCWLNGELPDLKHDASVVRIQNAHLLTLIALGINGFRFDAAKHIAPATIKTYINTINKASKSTAWNYLEVIEDQDTKPGEYTSIAAITDYRLCKALRRAFEGAGDLRSLRVPDALEDPRSVTFAISHDTDPEINPTFPACQYRNRGDGALATAYVLARESGTPLILGKDNLTIAYVPTGVRFRQIMAQRQREGKNVKETVLAAIDSPTLLLMERGAEGFFLVNKAADKADLPSLDLTLSSLEGCYKELRNGFSVAIERRSNGNKYVTRWGTGRRGGVEVQGRDALFFVREPFEHCVRG